MNVLLAADTWMLDKVTRACHRLQRATSITSYRLFYYMCQLVVLKNLLAILDVQNPRLLFEDNGPETYFISGTFGLWFIALAYYSHRLATHFEKNPTVQMPDMFTGTGFKIMRLFISCVTLFVIGEFLRYELNEFFIFQLVSWTKDLCGFFALYLLSVQPLPPSQIKKEKRTWFFRLAHNH